MRGRSHESHLTPFPPDSLGNRFVASRGGEAGGSLRRNNKSAIASKKGCEKTKRPAKKMAAPHLMRSYGRGVQGVQSCARFSVEMPLRDVALRNLASRAIEPKSKEKMRGQGSLLPLSRFCSCSSPMSAVEPHSTASGDGVSQLQPRNLLDVAVQPSTRVAQDGPVLKSSLSRLMTGQPTSRPLSGKALGSEE
jgi:hypothetical protein